MHDVIGWDIGGVNTKVARVSGGEVRAVRGRPYELQRNPAALAPMLQALAVEVGADDRAVHALTMTAELSQMFRTKRDGVAFVLDAVAAAFPVAVVRVFAVDGRLLLPEDARREPLAVAAANWSATAHAVARQHAAAVLIDIGTTTTDIIPIVGGAVLAEGWTDPARLASGELVYTGALRTPAEAIVQQVPLRGAMVGVSAECFALAGDVHVWRGDLSPADYTVTTPDGRPATREFAGERLARVVCADREMIDEADVSAIADAVAAAQVSRIADNLGRVLARHPSLQVAVVTGLGAFLGAAAAGRLGLKTVHLAEHLGEAAARCAPAASVALLLEQVFRIAADRNLLPIAAGPYGQPVEQAVVSPGPPVHSRAQPGDPALGVRHPGQASGLQSPISHHDRERVVDTVVKLGGGVLANTGHFDAVLAAISAAALHRPLLVVPGGGPFADAVRAVDSRYHLSDDAAHWMAVLAMDQYARLVVSRLSNGQIVEGPREMRVALAAGLVPVLAPSLWLREADPLPHSWDVTSDSIAAWVAGQTRAHRLVVIKPAGAEGRDLVDSYFSRALPAGITVVIVAADRIDALHAALRG
ncbi:MAG: hydantoinase/oxoprolinase family protein [Acidobacteriota bacterium]